MSRVLVNQYGDDWYHYRARVMRPDAGRFVQRDPAGYGDGASLYPYVRNRPLDANDPTGRECTFSIDSDEPTQSPGNNCDVEEPGVDNKPGGTPGTDTTCAEGVAEADLITDGCSLTNGEKGGKPQVASLDVAPGKQFGGGLLPGPLGQPQYPTPGTYYQFPGYGEFRINIPPGMGDGDSVEIQWCWIEYECFSAPHGGFVCYPIDWICVSATITCTCYSER